MNTVSVEQYTGCLLGGAIGDALGAPVEFMSTPEIQQRFGPDGVTAYLELPDNWGRFTDDTQMTLFTAEGLLRAQHREMLKGIGGALIAIVYQSYLRWLYTQGLKPVDTPPGMGVYDVHSGWLVKQPGLYMRRAPGNTCLAALQSGRCGSTQRPLNESKGCGGVMRVAPVGLMFYHDAELAFNIGRDTAAITHGHPSGYLSAGCLASIIACLVQGKELWAAVEETLIILKKQPSHQECLSAIEQALALSRTSDTTPEAVESLGGGWVGEEALAISLFCALRHPTDFRRGVLAAVNHSGDSDSTGAITGNILGVLVEKENLPALWIEHLDMADVVEQISVDLYTGVQGNSFESDPDWLNRYPPF